MSQDKNGAGLGVERQERECRELIQTKDELELVRVFVDNDVSASTGKTRPGYLDLLEAIRSGAVAAVVSWHTDRLHRSPIELEEYISLGVPTFTVKAGPLDLATPAGRMAARTFCAVARYEVEQKSERQKSKNRQTALAGLPPSGGPVPWGFNPDRLTLHPEQSQTFQDIHRRILGGESLGSVLRWLAIQQVQTPRGGTRWSYSSLRNVLLRPLNAGLVYYDGAILTNVQSQWQPLVTPEQHYAMVALLGSSARRTTSGSRRRHLLAGIATCANCRKPLKSGAVGSRSGKKAYLYRCVNPDCSARVNVARDHLDRYATDRLLAERGGAWVARLSSTDNVGTLWADVEARIGDVTARLAQDDADVPALLEILSELKAERTRLTKPHRQSWKLTDVAGDWLRAKDLNARRELLLDHLEELTVASRGRTSHRFDPERVTLKWQADRYDEAADLADKEANWG